MFVFYLRVHRLNLLFVFELLGTCSGDVCFCFYFLGSCSEQFVCLLRCWDHFLNMVVVVKFLGPYGLPQDPLGPARLGHAGPGQAYAIRLPSDVPHSSPLNKIRRPNNNTNNKTNKTSSRNQPTNPKCVLCIPAQGARVTPWARTDHVRPGEEVKKVQGGSDRYQLPINKKTAPNDYGYGCSQLLMRALAGS